jgi:choline dehydrogenase-like flavoprotein
MADTPGEYDLIVIGSGFGGAMAAAAAVHAGRRVLMIERGDWVARSPENWGPLGFCELTGAYSREAPYLVTAGSAAPDLGLLACVGGASVFFGGVAIRLREKDFEPDPDLDDSSGAEWPFRYADLEPYYTRVEQMLGVAGDPAGDRTEPPRSAPYPQAPAPLAPISQRIEAAARGLGLSPSRLPLAINYSAAGRAVCVKCNTCDGFACAVSAKNDVATALLPPLLDRGLELRTNTVAVRLVVNGRRISDVLCVDRQTRDARRFRARAVVVSAGALATPHLLLASDLASLNPAGDLVGRHLMRHCNAVVMGVFLKKPAPDGAFHKQIAITDYYFGHPDIAEPRGKLGTLQQWGTPQVDYVLRYLRGWKRAAAAKGVPHTTGLIAIAEDKPQAANRVSIEYGSNTRFGLPRGVVRHEYAARDLAARAALVTQGRRILRKAGALATIEQEILTFSHAVGTVRLGSDPTRAPLDSWGAFRGLDNLWVADGSVFPRSGGVNPSLTIAATALRTGERIAQTL